MAARVALELVPADSPERAVAEADVVTTATGASAPVFDGSLLRPGTHVNAVGSNFASKREVDETAVLRASAVVADDVDVAARECGDLIPLAESGRLAWESVLPLADVVAGKVAGRRSPHDITRFDLVEEVRQRGVVAVAETCPHLLCLDDTVYQGPDAVRFLMTPPIRAADLVDGMWERVLAGLVQSVGSDHCGYSLEQRGDTSDFRQVANPGIPGTETLLPLTYSFGVAAGRLDLPALVRITSANPARVFGLWPRKGHIAAGVDADLVLFDPAVAGPLTDEELHSAAGFTPFAGLELAGRVRSTFSRGRLIYDRGRVLGEAGYGRFLERTRFDAKHLA